MPQVHKYVRSDRRTGRKKTVYLNKAVVVTFNVEAARGLNAQDTYSWEWKFATKREKPIARITKLFKEGPAGKRQAKRWELDRKDDIRMWMVSRKTEQVICVGSDVEITVLGVQSGRVRLGIEAPRDIRIRRGELEAFDPPDESGTHACARSETVG